MAWIAKSPGADPKTDAAAAVSSSVLRTFGISTMFAPQVGATGGRAESLTNSVLLHTALLHAADICRAVSPSPPKQVAFNAPLAWLEAWLSYCHCI